MKPDEEYTKNKVVEYLKNIYPNRNINALVQKYHFYPIVELMDVVSLMKKIRMLKTVALQK